MLLFPPDLTLNFSERGFSHALPVARPGGESGTRGCGGGYGQTSVLAQPRRQGFQLILAIIAHEANLQPVAPAEIIAVVAEQKAGPVRLLAELRRILTGRQDNGDHAG